MRKKTLSFILTTILTMSLFAGCGKEEKSNVDSTPTVTATTEPTTAPTVVPEVTKDVEPTTEAEDTFSTEAIEAAGKVDGVTYSNSLVGFSVSAPETWLMYGTEETYEWFSKTTGIEVDELKKQVNSQGASYLSYSSDTQLSENGAAENFLIQAMNIKAFAGLSIENIIESLTALISNQYKAMGATCEMSDPVKTTMNGQDIYQVTVKAIFSVSSDDTTTEQNVYQEYIIYEKNNVLIYMAVSTQSENSASVKAIMDSLSFQ